MELTSYAERRRQLAARIGDRAVAVIAGKSPTHRNGDVENRYRQPSDLLYLTGFSEPEAVAVIAPGRSQAFHLFVRPRDPVRETWTGRRVGTSGAKEMFGADASYPIDALGVELPHLLDGAEEVVYSVADDPLLDQVILKALAHLRAGERKGMRAPSRIKDLRTSLHELRLLKDAHALSTLRKAAAITREAHVAAMKAARPGVHEYEIEALIDYTFRRNGGFAGYGTIVGGGANATILHYVDNAEALRAGDLLLVDAGCEIDGFTADVTRTYPVGGHFSPTQRAAYQLVLDAETQCIAAVHPGNTIEEIHRLAVEILTRGMIELGLLQGRAAELIASEGYKRFFMHRTSHWLGMDVHDVGAYQLDGKPRPLLPGMVLTVEPGLYVSAEAEGVPSELKGLGIRIEDDILVTEGGHEILTAEIPKDIEALERLTI